MSTYSVLLLAIVALAVLTLAVYLYLQSRPPRPLKNPPAPQPSRVKPCKWDPTQHTYEENHSCLLMCGPPYKPGHGPVQATINGKTWLYCCPMGYTPHIRETEEICIKD